MRIAVLTSGGDAPGMNAAVRAMVRTALGPGWEVRGLRQGFAGLRAAATEQLARGRHGVLVGLHGREIGAIPLAEVAVVRSRGTSSSWSCPRY